jgi:hypothetical protein
MKVYIKNHCTVKHHLQQAQEIYKTPFMITDWSTCIMKVMNFVKQL